jgi:hypothetical protein
VVQTMWTDTSDFEGLLRQLVKESGRQARRANGGRPADWLGPGIAALAIQIADWNDPTTLTNGNFWSEPDANNSPNLALRWTGSTIAKSNGSGMQQVWNTDDLDNVRYFMRTYVDDGTGQGAVFSAWRNFATPTGFVEYEDLGTDIQDQLDAAAAAIGIILPPLQVYRQVTSPTNPDAVGRALQIGDQWLDTDDNNHPYLWDGTAWVDYATYVLGDIPAQVSAAQAAAEAAASAASDAMDFAVTITKVYRQNAAPTNPASDGRALVQDAVWFDQDDSNKMYTWTGSAWVLLNIATESYAASQAASAQAAAIAAAAADATTKAGNAQSAAIAAAAADATTKAAAAQAAATAVANTKNVVFRQSTTPTSLTAGDVWFDTGHDNAIYRAFAAGVNTIGSSAWVLTQIGNTAIADDAITSAKIFANTIQTTDLVATAIDGMTVTGATLQTIVTAARGIKINTSGLTAYNGSGVATLTINASTGAISMLGDLTSGSNVTGATVTGGTVQSEVTAARGIKITSGGLTAYNGSGVAQFTIDAATGSVALAGALTGAGTITGPTFQTTATLARGIKISSSGLVAFDATGVTKFNIDASTGNVTMAGSLTSGSTIDGAIVTGGTLQTTATAARGVKITSTGLAAFDGSGVTQFSIDGTTGALILAGPMTGGGSITGPIFQTIATAARGVKITSGGLTGYDASGVGTIVVDASTGNVTIKGALTSGSTIDGSTLTGGTVQTEATASRGIKMNSTGLVAYNTSGVVQFTLDATTGSITLAGTVTGGGSITGPTFATASSGKRITVSSSPVNKIQFFSGNTFEIAAGYIQIDAKTPVSGQEDVNVQLMTPALQLPSSGPQSLTSLFNMSARVNSTTLAVDTNAGLYTDKIEYAGSGTITGLTTRRLTTMNLFGTLNVSDLGGTGGGVGVLQTRGYTVPEMTLGQAVVTTNGSGQATFTNAQQLPIGASYIYLATGGNDEHVYVIPGFYNAAGFVAQFRTATGVLIASSSVRCYWVGFAV